MAISQQNTKGSSWELRSSLSHSCPFYLLLKQRVKKHDIYVRYITKKYFKSFSSSTKKNLACRKSWMMIGILHHLRILLYFLKNIIPFFNERRTSRPCSSFAWPPSVGARFNGGKCTSSPPQVWSVPLQRARPLHSPVQVSSLRGGHCMAPPQPPGQSNEEGGSAIAVISLLHPPPITSVCLMNLSSVATH